MKSILKMIFVLFVFFMTTGCEKESEVIKHEFALAIHGGAGTILKSNMTDEKEKAYNEKLEEVLNAGFEILNEGGSSLDAVQKCINLMEDSPLFNSGKGAVFTADGKNELDASIMEGKTLNAGAVAGVSHIKNPIDLARLVMEKSPHVMMAREGAEAFAVEQGMELVDEKYFYTERRWKQLQSKKVKENQEQSELHKNISEKFGTVGVVALDKDGNLAAGTSTGGMTYKKFGRVGDSPIIGAGTYANNKSCAVSATGHGEYFIRGVIAHDIAALMEYQDSTVKEAAETVINKKLTEMGGTGGIIAIDADGNIALTFNTEGMYRGYIYEDGKAVIKIYGE
jgi:L-asparaginase / beta-aspartyl-peptidase